GSSRASAVAAALATGSWPGNDPGSGCFRLAVGCTGTHRLQGLPNARVAAVHADFCRTIRSVDVSQNNALGKCALVRRHSLLRSALGLAPADGLHNRVRVPCSRALKTPQYKTSTAPRLFSVRILAVVVRLRPATQCKSLPGPCNCLEFGRPGRIVGPSRRGNS